MYCMLSVYFWKGNSTYTALSFVSPALTPQKHQAFFPTQWSPLSFPFLSFPNVSCLLFPFLSTPFSLLFFSFLFIPFPSYHTLLLWWVLSHFFPPITHTGASCLLPVMTWMIWLSHLQPITDVFNECRCWSHRKGPADGEGDRQACNISSACGMIMILTLALG